MQPDLVKIEFIVKFDPSLLILLCDDASFVSILKHNDVYFRVYIFSIGHVSCDFLGAMK